MTNREVDDEILPGDAPTGKMRTFVVTLSKTVEISLDESVIAQGASEGEPIFGFKADEAGTPYAQMTAVEHLAYNLVGNNLSLSDIDGYANCPDKSAVVPYEKWDVEDIRETTPVPKKAPGKKRMR